MSVRGMCRDTIIINVTAKQTFVCFTVDLQQQIMELQVQLELQSELQVQSELHSEFALMKKSF